MLAACGGHNVTDPLFATSMVLNKIKGTPLSDTPQSVRINQMILESEEDVVNYFKYCESGRKVPKHEEVCGIYNKSGAV